MFSDISRLATISTIAVLLLAATIFAGTEPQDAVEPVIVDLPKTIEDFEGTLDARRSPPLPPPKIVPECELLLFRGSLITHSKPPSIFYAQMPDEIGISIRVKQSGNALIQRVPTKSLPAKMTAKSERFFSSKSICVIAGIIVGICLTPWVLKLVTIVLPKKAHLSREARSGVPFFVCLAMVIVLILCNEAIFGGVPKDLYLDNATGSDVSIIVNSEDPIEVPKLSHRLLKIDSKLRLHEITIVNDAGESPSRKLVLKTQAKGWYVLNVAGRNHYTVQSQYYVPKSQ